jgi:hypothetical protein
VDFDVLILVVCVVEHFTANIARMLLSRRFLLVRSVCVDLGVPIPVMTSRKLLATHLTGKLFHLRQMERHVRSDTQRTTKLFLTQVAFVQLIVVRLLVTDQLGLPLESRTTLATLERPVIPVHDFVFLQHRLNGRAEAAFIALVVPVDMQPIVMVQLLPCLEQFNTNLAKIFLLSIAYGQQVYIVVFLHRKRSLADLTKMTSPQFHLFDLVLAKHRFATLVQVIVILCQGHVFALAAWE